MEDNEEFSQKNVHIEEESDEEDYESKIENQLNKKFFPPNVQNETKKNKNEKHLQILNDEADHFKSYMESESEYKPNHSKDEGRPKVTQIESILDKFSKHMKFQKIGLSDFWKKEKLAMSSSEFEKLLKQFIVNFAPDETEELIGSLIDYNGEITLKTLCSKVETWKTKNDDYIFEVLKDQSLKKAVDMNKKINPAGNPKAIRPYTSAVYSSGNARPISSVSMKSYRSKYNGTSEIKIYQSTEHQIIFYSPAIAKPQPRNNSAFYLKKTKEKEQEAERLLQLTISRGKNEYEYECLIKMGKANDLSQAMQSKITYRAYKSSDGNLKVNVYDLDKRIKELSLEEFQREFNILKNQFNQSKKLKIWEVLNENKKNARFSPSVDKKENEKKETDQGQSKTVNKNKRQTDLKQVLLETMMLTNTLKEQLHVLNKKGINGNYQNSPRKLNHPTLQTFQ